MITKQSFNFSDSLVLKELVKIGREKGLVTEDEEVLFVPELKKKASVKLQQTGNLLLDTIVLATELKNRGYVKQGEILVEKALELKKKLADSGHDSLYNFWSETGEGFENAAHPHSNDVAGHKVPDLNEAQQQIHSTVRKEPTGDVKKATLMAKMFEMVVKEAAGDDIIDYALKIYNKFKTEKEWSGNQPKYVSSDIYDVVYAGLSSGIISPELKSNFNLDLSDPTSATDILGKFIKAYKSNEKFAAHVLAATEIIEVVQSLGSEKQYIDILLSNNPGQVAPILRADNDDSEDWGGEIKNLASFFLFRAVERGKTGETSAATPGTKPGETSAATPGAKSGAMSQNEMMAGGAGTGAVIGTPFGGPVGTAVGAGIGAAVGAGAHAAAKALGLNNGTSITGIKGKYDGFSPWQNDDLEQIKTVDQLIKAEAESNDWVINGFSDKQIDFLTNIRKLQDQIPGAISLSIDQFARGLIKFNNDLTFVEKMQQLASEAHPILMNISNLAIDLNIPKANEKAMEYIGGINKVLTTNLNDLEAAKLILSTIPGLDKSPEEALQKLTGYLHTYKAIQSRLTEAAEKKKKTAGDK